VIFINNKGQAFSVFNLLIAAVVALAILGLLFTIMSQASMGKTNDPSKVVKDSLKNSINNPFTPKTNIVDFDKTHKTLNTMALATDTGMSSDDIKFCLHEKLTDSFQLKTGGKILQYQFNAKKTVKTITICGGNTNKNDFTSVIKTEDDSCNPENNIECVIIIKPKYGK